MLTIFEFANILPNRSSPNAGVALDVHVIAQGKNNGLDLGRELSSRGEYKSLRLSNIYID